MGSPLKAETRVQIPFAPVAKANSSAKTAEPSIVAGEATPLGSTLVPTRPNSAEVSPMPSITTLRNLAHLPRHRAACAGPELRFSSGGPGVESLTAHQVFGRFTPRLGIGRG